MNKKTIYFHIGTTKTGSTSIQDFLVKNRDALCLAGVAVYSGKEEEHPSERLRVPRPFCDGVDVSFIAGDGESWSREFIQRLKNRSEKTIILTEEVIWFSLFPQRKQQRIISFIDQLKELGNVKIIVYLRRQDDFLMSSYQECLKYGWMKGLTCRQEARRKQRYAHYRDLLEPLIPVVGTENILVRPFEPGQFAGGSLLHDFMGCLNTELTKEYDLPVRKSNMGLSPFFSEILRCISFFRCRGEYYRELVRFAFKHSAEYLNSESGHQYLPPVDRHNYMMQFEEGNRWIARELLGREDEILFYEPLPKDDGTWREYRLDPQDVKLFFQDADFLSKRIRKKMCRQVVSVCGGRKPLRFRVRDRLKAMRRKFSRKTGLRRLRRRIFYNRF